MKKKKNTYRDEIYSCYGDATQPVDLIEELNGGRRIGGFNEDFAEYELTGSMVDNIWGHRA